VGKLMERLAVWVRGQESYQPPEGRLTQDTVQRLPSGGQIQKMPGDGIDPLSPDSQAGRNP